MTSFKIKRLITNTLSVDGVSRGVPATDPVSIPGSDAGLYLATERGVEGQRCQKIVLVLFTEVITDASYLL